ncbi:F-box domain-containing protein [Rhizoctonia solani]|uniref:F-box domain-containing protein n=1 Tax=Rhizoctonia solani TaxID=456999 RepID=A0A8H8P927_9AGAM|nr:F-box domain-containing protein [Rhizoctonia solani]QRW26046.1 F-box domain-containing protein [Rhizoctonia solani]
MSPIDLRIAELEASMATERASRLSASPKILSNLRPGPTQRRSSLALKTGISRLPRIEVLARRDPSEIIFGLKFARLGSDNILLGYDLTLDTGAWPTRLNHEFYSIVKDALDRTRNLRRLALLLDSDIVRVSPRTRRSDLSQVYDTTLYTKVLILCLVWRTFLDFQSMIRTLQIPYRPAVMRSSFALPPHVTQLWLPLSGHANGFHYNNIGKISHLSIKGEPLPSSLEQFRDSPIHYLAHDLSSWTATRLMLPGWLQRLVPEMFSNLQVLRLIDYWVTCETADNATSFPQPNSTSAVTELADWDTTLRSL